MHDVSKVAELTYEVDYRTFDMLFKSKESAVKSIAKELPKRELADYFKVILDDDGKIIGMLEVYTSETSHKFCLKSLKLIIVDILDHFVLADIKRGDLYLAEIAIDSKLRGQGIGRKVLCDVIGYAKSKEDAIKNYLDRARGGSNYVSLRELSAWIAADPERQAAWGGAIDAIAEGINSIREPYLAATLINETLGRIEVCGFADAAASVPEYVARLRERNPESNVSEQELYDQVLASIDEEYKDYDAKVDRDVAIALIDHYKANVNPADAIKIDGKSILSIDTRKFVDNLFKKSIFTSPEKLHAKPLTAKMVNADPAVQLSKAAGDVFKELRAEVLKADDAVTDASRSYGAALLKWQEGKPSYPDANSTCRFTYGTVKSYEPKDGVLYKYYTTLKGVMEKEDPDNYEFRVPAKLKEIYQNKDYGQYADRSGELVTCFLTNLDITGGNSGSPVMDADGNLIGLAFDGNWEAMSSDVMFEPNLQRCICVDIRYVLLMVDKFAGAGYLLDEMNLVKE